jgi:hypothetical protein
MFVANGRKEIVEKIFIGTMDKTKNPRPVLIFQSGSLHKQRHITRKLLFAYIYIGN